MKKLASWILSAVLFVGVAGPANAALFQKGQSLFALNLTEGVADLVGPINGAGYLAAYSHSEIGIGAQYWHFMSTDYALNVNGGLGFFGETDQPGVPANPGDQDFKYTQSSWQLGVGADRFGHLSDRFHVYAGPGLQIWNGKAKFEGGPAPVGPAVESQSTTRISLTGRIGVMMMLNENLQLLGQLGHYIGHASADEQGAKATWWPSGNDAACGVVFTFGPRARAR
jgi:hypothetical protein